MSIPSSPLFRATTADDLRLVISEVVSADPELLKSHLSQILVTTSDKVPLGGLASPPDRSLFDRENRVLTLLADRISLGQEALVFAQEISIWLGPEVARDLIGNELVFAGVSLSERLSKMECPASLKAGVLTLEDGISFSLADVVGALQAVADAPANSNSEPDVMGAALDGCVSVAQHALGQMRAAIDIGHVVTKDQFYLSLEAGERPVFSQADGGFVISAHPELGSFPRSYEDALLALAKSRGIELLDGGEASLQRRPFEGGDKVFLRAEKRLATVLNVYGDGVNGDRGDIRLDVSGNTAISEIEHYDAAKHSAFDNTFIPIKAEWKRAYGITKDIPLREDMVLSQLRDVLRSATDLGIFDEMAAYVHPDVINEFCDAAEKMVPQEAALSSPDKEISPSAF